MGISERNSREVPEITLESVDTSKSSLEQKYVHFKYGVPQGIWYSIESLSGLPQNGGIPQQVSNSVSVWIIGIGKEKTVILLQFIPNPSGGVIRIKIGGGQAISLIDEVIRLIKQISYAIVSRIESIPD